MLHPWAEWPPPAEFTAASRIRHRYRKAINALPWWAWYRRRCYELGMYEELRKTWDSPNLQSQNP